MAPGAAGAETPASSSPPEEVLVHGKPTDPGEVAIDAHEARLVPGAFDDPLHAIDALPGTTPLISGFPYFFVRGAPPGNTGTLLDGVRVPMLYHLGLEQSVVNPGIIDRVDFYPGGFPARFGRFAGGILSAQTTDPATVAHAEANVRLFDASALGETPFDGGRGSALVAGRYSYTGLVLPLFSNDKLSYWDYQTRVTWEVAKGERIGVFAFGSHDDFSQRDSTGMADTLEAEFHRIDLRYDHAIGKTGTLRVAATLGFDRANDGTGAVHDLLAGLRADLNNRITPAVHIHAGFDATYDHLTSEQDPTTPGALLTDVLYPRRNNDTIGSYVDVAWRITSRVEIVPGLRADLFTTHRLDDARVFPVGTLGAPSSVTPTTSIIDDAAMVGFDPRLAARVSLSSAILWISAFGISHQLPAFFVPTPASSFDEAHPTLETAIQASQGLQVALPLEITATATLFLQDFKNLADLSATCPGSTDLLSASNISQLARNPCLNETVPGRAFGAELFVRRSLTKRITGWITYTLSRSTREAHLPDSNATVTTLSEFDRPHVVSVIGAYDFGRGWRAGARFYAYSGLPYSDTIEGNPVPPYNTERLPAFYRIDLRLEKRWRLGERASIAVIVEGQNITANKEATGASCTPMPSASTTALDKCTPVFTGPLTLPSIGIEGSL
jgi:hypothetical protein